MLIRRSSTSVTVYAPAKVNLFLEVLGKRADGYHDLATLMLAVSLYDTLEIRDEATGGIRLTCDQPELSTGPDNLIVRAAALLQKRSGYAGGCHIRLWKRIPMAAGLAGGSSDAAATLAGLNVVWRLGLDKAELAALGAEIGSDVAFFFSTPAAWCTGRGERVEPMSSGRRSTWCWRDRRRVYRPRSVFQALRIADSPNEGHDVREAFRVGDLESLGKSLHNRLQRTAEQLCPAVAEVSRQLAAQRPAGVLMSGSGSTAFALCRDPADAARLARALRSAMDYGTSPRVWIVRSCV